REKSGHRGGDIWHQHSPQLPVLLAVLHRVGLRQAAGRLLRLGRAAQLYRLNKGLDPDAERPGGLALIHLQDQGRLAAALPQQADDLIGQ
ncbi:hypothetical protein EJMLMN_EJMLMN_12095, partial [Dysosmobacter welbionis]